MMNLELLWSVVSGGFVLGGILFFGFFILAGVEKGLQPGKESTLLLKLLQCQARIARYKLRVAVANIEAYKNLDSRRYLSESDEIDYLLNEESSGVCPNRQ